MTLLKVPLQLKSSYASQRDPRIDFFRGVALIVILAEHIEMLTGVHGVLDYTFDVYGPVDALALFVFFSGYVFGLAYYKTLQNQGFWACQIKAVRRAGQLYLANAVIYFVVLASILHFSLQQSRFTSLINFADAARTPILTSIYFLLLLNHPFCLDILPLYIVIILGMPSLLFMLKHRPTCALIISYGIYLLTQLCPLNLPTYPWSESGWHYNPFSWQFLFFIGMLLSYPSQKGTAEMISNKWTLLIAVMFVVAISVAYLDYKANPDAGAFPFVARATLGPLRLLYFLCLVYIMEWCFRSRLSFWHSIPANPIICCGKNSLSVFCLGLLLTFLCAGIHFGSGGGDVSARLLELAAILVSIAFAMML